MEANWIFGIGTIVATLLGPIFAVQVQKYLERVSATKNQKSWIFSTLMATRATRLSADHVRALNMIDLAFNGGSSNRRKATETNVLDTWRDYLDHLTTKVTKENEGRWGEKQQELLVLMLIAMAADLNLRFDRVLIRNGAYNPMGHMALETDYQALRFFAIKVLSGEQPISMNVTGFPTNEAMTASHLKLQAGLSEILSGRGHLKIRIDPSPSADEAEKTST